MTLPAVRSTRGSRLTASQNSCERCAGCLMLKVFVGSSDTSLQDKIMLCVLCSFMRLLLLQSKNCRRQPALLCFNASLFNLSKPTGHVMHQQV